MKDYAAVSLMMSVTIHAILFFVFSWFLLSWSHNQKKIEIIRNISELKIIPEMVEGKREEALVSPFSGESSVPPPFMRDVATALDVDYHQTFSLKSPTTMEEKVGDVVVAYDGVDATLRKMPEYMHYYQAVRAKLDRTARKLYDGEGEGVVIVSFIVSSDGRLQSVSLETESAPSAHLRAIALKTIYDAVPFPSFPQEFKNRANLPFIITINFKNN